MKKLRIVLLPAALILIGAGAAFATNATKATDDDPVPGYLYDNSTGLCVQKRDDCSRSGITFCTWKDANKISHILTGMSATSCPQVLFEPVK